MSVHEKRIHFTEDRLLTNPYFKIVIPEQIKSMIVYQDCNLNTKSNGSFLLDIDFQKNILLPAFDFNNCSRELTDFIFANKNIYGITFIRLKNKTNGHLISHEGFIVENKLIHASKNAGKVIIEEDFGGYMRKAGFDCFTLFNAEVQYNQEDFLEYYHI